MDAYYDIYLNNNDKLIDESLNEAKDVLNNLDIVLDDILINTIDNIANVLQETRNLSAHTRKYRSLEDINNQLLDVYNDRLKFSKVLSFRYRTEDWGRDKNLFGEISKYL